MPVKYDCYSFCLFVVEETATRLGSGVNEDTESGYASPKPPPTKSVSWASSVTSSTDGAEQQEIIALRLELKEAMKENLKYVHTLDFDSKSSINTSIYF